MAFSFMTDIKFKILLYNVGRLYSVAKNNVISLTRFSFVVLKTSSENLREAHGIQISH